MCVCEANVHLRHGGETKQFHSQLVGGHRQEKLQRCCAVPARELLLEQSWKNLGRRALCPLGLQFQLRGATVGWE